MSEYKYITMSPEEKRILKEAREQRFGEGRRVSLGAFARIMAEQSLESEETA